MKNFENFEVRTSEEKEKREELLGFLVKQISLPSEKWNDRFKEYIREKLEEKKKREKESEELSPEEAEELDFKRYLRALNIDFEKLKGKKILDLGCGEGGFVKKCVDKGIKEVYGLDKKVNPESFEKRYKNHFLKGDFEKELPIRDFDYIFSVGAVFAPVEKSEKRNPPKTLLFALEALKKNGEIRIYPICKAPPKSNLKGIEYSRKRWEEILKDLSKNKEINYVLQPIDIAVSGKKPDVWLEEVLIIKKNK